ncbi:uncharacterized protein LOC110814548 [Carica papaya]|uniref:uncharacterized protein LOC110814548 n=1 Tax=Carica papaya TaxID=3649 RepID=UPI000B8C9F13|nr:uncharacterized protein LOC110814548 [Carica papaya]
MVSISKIDQTSAAVTASEGTEPDLAVPSYSKEQIRDAIGGRDVEDCAEIDGVNRNLDCSAEVQVDKVDAVDGSTGNSCSLPADSSSLGQKSEVIVAAEDADMDGKELPSVKQDPQLNLEECLDEDTTCCPAQVNSNSVQKIEIDKQEAEQQEGKVEAINNTADGTLSADSRHSSQSSQEADRGEVEAMDYNVFSDPNFDVTNYIDFSDVFTCSGNVKHMKAEIMPTEIGSNLSDKVEKVAAMDNQEVLKPNCGIEESTESDRQENDKMDLDNITEHGTGAYKDHEQNFSGQDTLIFGSSYHRRKHNLKDYHSKKERSLSELMGDALDSPDVEIGPDEKVSNKSISAISGKKRKAIDSVDDESQHEGRKTISLAKVSLIAPNFPKPSFKIGECIRRAASQITGSPSAILKSSSDKFLKAEGSSDGLVVDGYDVSMEASGDALRKGTIMSTDYSSLDELLSQLHLAALDPFRGYNFLNIIVSFFSDFRNSVVVDQPSADKTSGKRKRTSSTNIGSSEAFEFEDMNDTYWTDRVIQNGTEEQQPSEKGGYQIVPVELGKPIQNQNQNQKSRRPYTRKRYSDSNIEPAPEKPPGYIDENAPAELVMNFSEMDALPSETNVNKMFRHFGPIRESDTEVDRETSRARVVFKKCSDAEVAYNSAGKFNIFGPMLVNYQLSYSISEPFKISPVLMSLGEEDTT